MRRITPAPEYGPLVDFWFDGDCIRRWRALGAIHEPGWRPVPEADAEAGTRFGHLVDLMASGALESWLADSRGRLAFVLVADALPRSFYRGSCRAYALDCMALEAAEGVAGGIDRQLELTERAFFYMPFTHAELAGAQERSVDCYRVLLAESLQGRANPKLVPIFESFLRSAERHAAIIRRFGRFPHRNASLRRETTADERFYLDDPWSYDFSEVPDLCSKMRPKTRPFTESW
jgi:uncharacterized protein (DUF924 family)